MELDGLRFCFFGTGIHAPMHSMYVFMYGIGCDGMGYYYL